MLDIQVADYTQHIFLMIFFKYQVSWYWVFETTTCGLNNDWKSLHWHLYSLSNIWAFFNQTLNIMQHWNFFWHIFFCKFWYKNICKNWTLHVPYFFYTSKKFILKSSQLKHMKEVHPLRIWEFVLHHKIQN